MSVSITFIVLIAVCVILHSNAFSCSRFNPSTSSMTYCSRVNLIAGSGCDFGLTRSVSMNAAEKTCKIFKMLMLIVAEVYGSEELQLTTWRDVLHHYSMQILLRYHDQTWRCAAAGYRKHHQQIRSKGLSSEGPEARNSVRGDAGGALPRSQVKIFLSQAHGLHVVR